MCIEPTSFTVKEESSFKGGESEFVRTKLMTRLTYTLDAVSYPMQRSHAAAAGNAALTFRAGERGRIDDVPLLVRRSLPTSRSTTAPSPSRRRTESTTPP